MVRLLIGLRATITRNQLARGRAWAIWVAVAVGLASAAGTLALGIVHGADVSGALDRVSAVLVLWLGGQLAQSALNGGETALRPELLALLPLGPRRLAWALLAAGLCDPSLVIVAIAYAAVIAVAADLGAMAILAAIAGAAGLLVLTSVAAAMAGGTLGPGSRRGRDLGTIVVAVAVSILAVAATLLSGLQAGRWPALTVALRVLPTGWPGDAVTAASHGQWPLTLIALAGPFALAAVIAAAWPGLLARRMTLATSASRRAGRAPGRPPALVTPAGAVAVKEILLWLREPVRVTFLLIALIVGVGVGVVPRVIDGTSHLMPFSGPLTVVIAGACATNLYGGDGTSLWLTVMTPRSAIADIRGRQHAWLLLVAPFATIETVILTAWSGQHALWPWALGLLIALLGGGAGLAPLASLISVQPLDDGGNPTPEWSVKVHIALVAVALTAAPAALALTLGSVSHDTAVSWLGVAIAALTATVSITVLGTIATRRLQARQVAILQTLVA